MLAIVDAWAAARRVNATTFVWRVVSSKTNTELPMRYTSWSSGQPNSERELCVMLYYLHNFDWHDSGCNDARNAVCEIDVA